MTFKLSLAEEFQIEKLKKSMEPATKEQLEELVIMLYKQDKVRTKYFIQQLSILTKELAWRNKVIQ